MNTNETKTEQYMKPKHERQLVKIAKKDVANDDVYFSKYFEKLGVTSLSIKDYGTHYEAWVI